MNADDKRMGNNPLDWIGKAQDPEPEKKVYEKSSKEGLTEDYIRATFIMREDLLEKIKNHAWYERKSIKDTINDIVEEYFEDKEVPERKDD